jgi:hypothetical protein
LDRRWFGSEGRKITYGWVAILILAACVSAPEILSPILRARMSYAAVDQTSDEAIVIVNVDALRRDELGIYGNTRRLTPYLDQLATREGVIFDYAFAASNHTRPSVTSLLTGLYPSHHGFWHQFSAPSSVRTRPNIATIVPTTYSTFFVNANPNTADEFEASFHHSWSEYPKAAPYAASAYYPAEFVFGKAIELLEAAGEPRRMVAYVQPADPHGPYYPRRDYPDLFVGDPLKGVLTGAYQSRLADLSSAEKPSAAELKNLRNRYDAEVRYLDEEIARFDGYLKSRYPHRVLIFTSDHGEAFFEHGDGGHGGSLYNEQIRVPLVIVDPRRRFGEPRRVDVPVSGVDLLPTVSELTGAVPPKGLDGTSLMETLRRFARVFPLTKERIIVSEVVHTSATFVDVAQSGPERGEVLAYLQANPVNALVRATIGYWSSPSSSRAYKLIANENPEQSRVLRRLGLEFQPHWRELYALDADAEERYELQDESTASTLLARSPLRGSAKAIMQGKVTITEEAIDRLRSLGYIRN